MRQGPIRPTQATRPSPTASNGGLLLPTEAAPLPSPTTTLAPTRASGELSTAPASSESSAPPALTWTPGSEPAGQIVYTCFDGSVDQICRLDASGGEPQQLTTSPATDFYPEWGPQGELITFSSRRAGEFLIHLMQGDGSDLRQVSGEIGSLFAPEISPDGQQIVFTNAQEGFQHIWLMGLDGSNARPLTNGPFNDIDPVWSPDGSQIAFASDRGWRPAHWIMDADGSNMRMLPDDVAEHGGRSSWSPDGSWLAFYAGPRDNRDIYLVATDGSGESRRLTSGGRNLAPDFSPDGNWITFTSYREGEDAEIYIMRPDGSDVRQLTFNESADWQPRWGP